MSQERERIDAVFQSYLKGSIGVIEAIDQITGPIDAALSDDRHDDYEHGADTFYSVLLDSAKGISFRDVEQHSKLVALLQAYKSHPEPSQKEPTGFYEKLHGFGIIAREELNVFPTFTEPEIYPWANLHYFYARLTATDDPILSFWYYCIWMMRDAVEYHHTDDATGTASQKYNHHVPAAAVYVFALGKQLYDKEADLTPTSPNQGNPAKGGDLWTGGPEFSKARWTFWKNRFSEISDMEGLSGETRAIAKEAYDIMIGCEET